MIQTSVILNIFDLCVITVILLSAMVSFYRGFVREILSLGSWVGAAMISLYSFPAVSEWIEPQVKSAAIASGLASIGVFMIALVSLSILTGLMMKFVKASSELGYIDNMVGLAFGIGRGILLVSIGYFVMTLVMSEKDYPDWLEDSASQPYVAKTANWVAQLAPSYLDTITGTDSDDGTEGDATDNAAPIITQPQHNPAYTITPASPASKEPLPDDETGAFPSFDALQQRMNESGN